MSVISATNVYFCKNTEVKPQISTVHRENDGTEEPKGHLSVPDGVNGVSNDGRSSLLTMVAEDGEDAPLPRVDGHLQVRVWIKKHALLQADSSQVCK